MGKLYVIDGLDGSGKSTQAQLVAERLKQQGQNVMLVSFPDYKEPSSALVKMYLNGEFGNHPEDVSAYAASAFYAVDRYASFKKHWKDFYEDGGIVIASRYVSSNILHQMGKLPNEKWDSFIDWLEDFEYKKLSLPVPNKVIYLEMSRKAADRLIITRYKGDESKKDIHEKDGGYLNRCEQAAAYAAKRLSWVRILCSREDKPLKIEDVNSAILKHITDDLR